MVLQELLQELRVIFYLKDILWVLLGIIAIILIFDLDKKIEAKLMTKRRRKKMKINMKKEKALKLLQEISCMFHGSDPVLKTEYRDAIYAVLDLIEKQDKEIESLRWKPIKEYNRKDYDWVLVKYYDGDFECVPAVAEQRVDGKWYTSEEEIPFEVKYFFDMQQLDKKGEIYENNKM